MLLPWAEGQMRVHKTAQSVQGFGSEPIQVDFLSPLRVTIDPDVMQVLVYSPFQQEKSSPPRLTRNCSDAEPQSRVLNPKMNQRGDPGHTWPSDSRDMTVWEILGFTGVKEAVPRLRVGIRTSLSQL